ncbi:MAG: hypothetical protein L6Q49_14435 [Anaerolineales bacterium]|nr:hypothetical protein [Anaerolineales bacterium]
MSGSYQQSSGRTASVLNFLVTVFLAIVLFIYLSLTAYTKDALWFYPVFDSQPAVGLLRCYGEEIALQAGSEELDAITTLVNEQISGDKRWDELNLTDETFQYFQTSDQMMLLELRYDEPQRIHSHSPFFSNFDTLLIPLDGRHAEKTILFSLVQGKPSGGSFRLETFAPLLSYIENNNLCRRK